MLFATREAAYVFTLKLKGSAVRVEELIEKAFNVES